MLYAPADWWPVATHRPIPYWQDAPPFTAPPEGWMLHVSGMNGSLYGLFAGLTAPNRRFSHLWVARAGGAEQYGPFSRVAWAAEAANPRFVMVETEGQPSEPLTDAQMDTLAALHVWLGAPDHIATAASEGGISCHYLGGAAWGGHTCPDPSPGAGPRSHQRAEILRRATGANVPLDPQDIGAIWGAGMPTADHVNAQTAISRTYAYVGSAVAKLDALTTAVAGLQHGSPVTLSDAQIQALAAAVAAHLPASGVTAAQVADELARRLTT